MVSLPEKPPNDITGLFVSIMSWSAIPCELGTATRNFVCP
jgi:hypothetical protein